MVEPRVEKPTVFVSYCSKDDGVVKDIATFMQTLKVEIKIDEEILLASNPIGDTLREHIQSSDGCLWVLTENSLKSKWCIVEVSAFWGAGKAIIIYNPFGISYDGPFRDIKQARSLDDIKRAVKGLAVRGKALSAVTFEEAAQVIEKSVSSAVQDFSENMLPVISRIAEYLDMQNFFLPNHAAVLSKVTEMVERAPQKLTCALDVPSFGSISAESEYRKCCDAFDRYITNEEWNLKIFLLPADVGTKIVNTEFGELKRRKKAWTEDIQALERFQGYQQRAKQRGRRSIELGWLAVNRDADGAPSGLHSMPLNIWIANDDEAVFSTVIDNYHPISTSSSDEGSQVQEIGFSTRNRDMVRFLIEITEKYARNIDETMTLCGQIAASKEARSRIERSMSSQDTNGN
jgi:hypothetical protein